MAVRPASVARPAPVAGRPFALGRAVEREGVFSWLMLVPGILFLLAFVAYPFFYGIFLSLEERRVAQPGTFVGLANFATALQDAVFWQVTRNTFVYTLVATFFKMVGGLAMALVINQSFRGRNLARAFLLLPAPVRADPRRPRQRHPPFRDLRVRHRHVGGRPGYGRGRGPRHAPRTGPAHRGAHPLPAARMTNAALAPLDVE